MNKPNTGNAYTGNANTSAQGQKPDADQVKPDVPNPQETAQEAQPQVTPRDVPLTPTPVQPVVQPDGADKTEKPTTAAPLQAAKGDDELMSKPAVKP